MNTLASLRIQFVLIIFCLFVNSLAFASYPKDIWLKWEINNPLSKEVISHQEWQRFLTRNIVTNNEGINLIDYPNIAENDIELLDQYIDHMSKIDISQYSRNEQLAFWTNLYNALVVQTIAQYYWVISVQNINISPGLFSTGPWSANIVTIKGSQLTLDQIEDRIIRPIWNDPRTLYALNDGTIGAANLSKKAFAGATIESQLNEAAIIYINSLRGVQLIDNKLIVSKLYEWFLNDFGDEEADVIAHLLIFAKEPLRAQLSKHHTIYNYSYNWHLNSTTEKRA